MDQSAKIKYIIISIVLVVVSYNLTKTTFDIADSNERLENLKIEVGQLEEERSRLLENIDYKNSPAYVEEEARNSLNLVRPGEKVYVLTESGELATLDKDEKSNKKQDVFDVLGEKDNDEKKEGYKDSNWYMWYKLFF